MVNWEESSWVDDGKCIIVVFHGALEAEEDGLHVHLCPYTCIHMCSLDMHVVRQP